MRRNDMATVESEVRSLLPADGSEVEYNALLRDMEDAGKVYPHGRIKQLSDMGAIVFRVAYDRKTGVSKLYVKQT